MNITIIDRFVWKSFAGPYLLSFFIAQFVLVMQFLWKHIDDILGKGFSVLDLIEMITYFAITQIPMALPIAILLSSVMVFGNMSERYELSSMKSAGISLIRIIRPALMLALATALLSLIASNYLSPQANFQFTKRMRAIKAQKPMLAIEEKIFNRDFNGFSIRVDEKDEETDQIKDVLVYDHTENDRSLVNLTKSKDGRMYNSPDGNYFVMELNDGISYRELARDRKKDGSGKKYPFMRTEFEEWNKYFNLSEFKADDNSINISKNKEDMLNTFQLLEAIDSVDSDTRKQYASIYLDKDKVNNAKEKARINRPSVKDALKRGNAKQAKKVIKRFAEKSIDQKQTDTLEIYSHWYETISPSDPNKLEIKALLKATGQKDRLRNASTRVASLAKKKNKYYHRLNQHYSFALICIVFLFIGAPLGSIIRKGGYGYPLLIAILFYMVFIITTIMGMKLVRSDSMNPFLAAWLANMIVAPVAVWLTIKALRDGKFGKLNIRGLFAKKSS